MKNLLVVRIFRNIAAILEIKGENVFRVRAYERAADLIDGLSQDIGELAQKGKLTEIPGIGKDLAGKIAEIVSTGRLAAYEELKKDVPEGLLEIMAIPMIGPKTAKMLHEKLRIESVDELEQAIVAGRLKGVRGIKEKTISNIEKGIALVRKGRERMPLAIAVELGRKFIDALKGLPEIEEISEAGSLRRRKETVRDIDILVVSRKPAVVMEAFTTLPWVKDIIARGDTKSSVRTEEDVQVDCRVVERRAYGAAMVYFTGSKNFNIHLRTMGVKKGWKTSEYGVFELSKAPDGSEREKYLAGKTEEDIFGLFGMSYVEPELREDTGEIELALEHKLPRIVTVRDMRGDLHSHSKWSDGGNTIEQMARRAMELGYSYLAVTDHSQGLKIARGLDPAALKKKKKEIDGLNKRLKNFRVLFGAETDIGLDGRMDYPDDILSRFDIVIGAIHAGFKQSRGEITGRMVAACKNKFVHLIAHPSGRLWGEREGYEIDFSEVFRAAAATNTAMEINSFPNRLDLNDQNCRLAKEMGVRIAINTDSHAVAHLDNMKLGVAVARRGWLEPRDVLNTLPLDKLLKAIKK